MVGIPTQGRSSRPKSISKWLIVVLLAVIAACLLVEVGLTTAAAQGQIGAAGKQDVFVVAGQVAPDTFGVYLVDLKNGTICVYQYVPHTKRLNLVAARTFLYDVQLDEYGTGKPLPREVKALVEKQRRLREVPPEKPGS
jgi:hypothetical protein